MIDQPTSGAGDAAEGRPLPRPWLQALCVFGLLLAVARGLAVGWDAPLWLDEAYTGAIAIRTSFAGLIEDCLSELSGPVYYAIMWAWVKVAGAGDVALRVPSLVFAFSAPLLVIGWGHSDRTTRWLWGTLCALWLPGAYFATEARAYSLLFLLGAVQVILFQRLLKAPSTRRAAAWCAVSALLILTHYHTLVLVGLQGLTYLILCRGAAFRTWPAALLFAPVAAWMAFHLPLLFRFADPAVAWQKKLGPLSVAELPNHLLGMGRLSPLVALVVAAGIAADLYKHARKIPPGPYRRLDMAAVAPSLLAIAFVFVLGMITPSFNARYFIPFMPGALLGLALWTIVWGRRWRPLSLLVLLVFIAMWARDFQKRASDPKLDFRRGYSWDEASDYLREQGVERLIFAWDNPTAVIADPAQLGRVGAFFLRREGYPIASDSVYSPGGPDGIARALLAAAAKTPGERVGTITLGRPMDFRRFDPQWTCRRFGGPGVAYFADAHATACYRSTPPKAG